MNDLSVELTDLKGDGIERARLYLTKVCEIQFPDGSHEWAEIQKLNNIRNCIVHAEGNVDDVRSPTKLRNIVKNTKGISFESERYLSIDNKYLEMAITWVEDFLQELHEKSFPNS
jgi:hypothetical protein